MHEALFPNVELFYLVWIFFGTQALIWGIMGIVKYSISDVPKEVEMQLLRQDFIRREAFHDDLFDEPPGARSLKKKKHTVSGTAAAVIAVLPHHSMEDCQLGGAEVPSEESQGGEISPLISSRHAEEELWAKGTDLTPPLILSLASPHRPLASDSSLESRRREYL